MNFGYSFFLSLIVLYFAHNDALAQGLATWAAERIGVGGLGRAVDSANDTLKGTIPVYGDLQDGAADIFRHTTTEVIVESSAPLLKNYIIASRNDAMNSGAARIPQNIMAEFSGFYSEDVLSAFWRVGQGNDLSLQANSFRFGDRKAIALDTVIVFRSSQDASDLLLWAHELAHIAQYRRWGIDDFTKKYIRDYKKIEDEADQRASEFLQWRQNRIVDTGVISRAPPPGGVIPSFTPPQNGQTCVTNFNSCNWFGPIGFPCMCASPGGLFNGNIR